MALIKIGNVKGPKGDKGDKGYPDLVVRNVYSSTETNVSIEQDPEVEGKYYLDFILSKGDTGNGILNATAQKVDGGTNVTLNYTDGTSNTFKLLDGLNGDGVLYLEGSITSNSIAAALLYVYNNVSQDYRYFVFKCTAMGIRRHNYLGYIYRGLSGPSTPKHIILLDLETNKKYTADVTNLTTSSTENEVTYTEETLAMKEDLGVINLGNLSTAPNDPENSILNNATRYDKMYVFNYSGKIHLMQCYYTGASLYQNIMYFDHQSVDGALMSFTRKLKNGSEIVTVSEVKKYASEKYVDEKAVITNLGVITDFIPGDSELDNVKTNGIYTFNMAGRPYLMFVYDSGYINQFIYWQEIGYGYKCTRRFYNKDAEEWTWSDEDYNLATESFVETKINSLSLEDLGTLPLDPQSEEYIEDADFVLNKATTNGKVYTFSYENNSYVMTVLNKGTEIVQNILKNNSTVFKRYVYRENGDPHIGSESAIGSTSVSLTLYEHNVDLTLVNSDNALGSTALFTVLNKSATSLTTSSLYTLLNGKGLRKATGVYVENSTTTHHIYGIEADSNGFTIYYDSGSTSSGTATFTTSKVSCADKPREI